MQQYLYDPPAGSPPLEWSADGRPIAVQPPDQFWKRVEETFHMADQYDKNGVKRKEVFRKRSVWVPDQDLNAAALKTGSKPDNTIWLKKADFRVVQQAKYHPLNQYLIPVKAFADRRQQSRALVDQEHALELKRLRETYEEQKKVERDGLVKEIQEMRASFRHTLQETAKEIGVDVNELEKALSKHRKDMTKPQKPAPGAGQ